MSFLVPLAPKPPGSFIVTLKHSWKRGRERRQTQSTVMEASQLPREQQAFLVLWDMTPFIPIHADPFTIYKEQIGNSEKTKGAVRTLSTSCQS